MKYSRTRGGGSLVRPSVIFIKTNRDFFIFILLFRSNGVRFSELSGCTLVSSFLQVQP